MMRLLLQLMLIVCLIAPEFAQAASGLTQDQVAQIVQMKQNAEASLQASVGYLPDYKLWSLNHNYIGLYYEGNILILNFKANKNLDAQAILQITDLALEVLGKKIEVKQSFQNPLTWGEAQIAQMVLHDANSKGIASGVNGSSLSPKTGVLTIYLEDLSDSDNVKRILNIFNTIGMYPGLIYFEKDDLVGR